jgi:outer membrane lipase/esterase
MRLLNRAMGRRILGACMLAVLASCGGGGDGDQSPKLQISRIVSFGDSLSDVGSYNTIALAGQVSLAAGLGGTANSGKFTVNSAGAKNWIELLAAQYGVAAPCPAQTGLQSVGPLVGFAQATQDFADCFAYAQGGARVTEDVGPGNVGTLPGASSGALGQLTRPVEKQVLAHLAKGTGGDSFSSDELVLVLAGGNDLFINLALVGAGAIDVPTAVGLMATAGTQLADLVKDEMLAKGASHVVVVNVPDVSLTPDSLEAGAQAQALTKSLTVAFNDALAAGLAGISSPQVVFVDAFTQSQEQAAIPEQFDLSNVTDRACDPALSVIDTSLVCNANTLIAGDTSKFLYADGVHPTPYGYKLLAQFVADRLVKAGLL